MMSTVTARAVNRAVLRKTCTGLCLMPTKHNTDPEIRRTTPEMAMAGVITGWRGNSSELSSGAVALAGGVGIGAGVLLVTLTKSVGVGDEAELEAEVIEELDEALLELASVLDADEEEESVVEGA